MAVALIEAGIREQRNARADRPSNVQRFAAAMRQQSEAKLRLRDLTSFKREIA